MAGMEDGTPVPVLHTDQIHGCLRALGAPEPEGLPRAVALEMLLMLVEALAAIADRFDQEQVYEGYTQSLHSALGLPDDCPDMEAEPCPAAMPWLWLMRSRITRTLLDMDSAPLFEDAAGPVPIPSAHHLLAAAEVVLTITVEPPDPSQPLDQAARTARDRLRSLVTDRT
ncbi:hypothetical protein [Streptomyces sp. NBC_00989]|uniref:hypothetical protein n=1 Tax=Streptomyces sp. NBC_00989 TaxID=2903705 RepID=UPI00386FA84C|nr:hypothetical protein OG714_25390 [Streptomyces sp. NBC_00989]